MASSDAVHDEHHHHAHPFRGVDGLVDESSKSGWYLLLLTLSIGG